MSTTIQRAIGADVLADVPIAELTRPQLAVVVRAFETSHHVTASTWRDAFRDRDGHLHSDAAFYRTGALYALLGAAA